MISDINHQNRPRVLRPPEVLDRVGLKKSVIYARIHDGTFPRQVKFGRASVWIEQEADSWIRQQVEQQRRAA